MEIKELYEKLVEFYKDVDMGLEFDEDAEYIVSDAYSIAYDDRDKSLYQIWFHDDISTSIIIMLSYRVLNYIRNNLNVMIDVNSCVIIDYDKKGFIKHKYYEKYLEEKMIAKYNTENNFYEKKFKKEKQK